MEFNNLMRLSTEFIQTSDRNGVANSHYRSASY